ncbi:uncharacterized protein LOC120342062 [Styela clava]
MGLSSSRIRRRGHTKAHRKIESSATSNFTNGTNDTDIIIRSGKGNISCSKGRIKLVTENNVDSTWRQQVQDGGKFQLYCRYSEPRLYWVPNRQGKLRLMDKPRASRMQRFAEDDYKNFILHQDSRTIRDGYEIMHVATKKMITIVNDNLVIDDTRNAEKFYISHVRNNSDAMDPWERI